MEENMGMKLTLEQFENVNLLSNRNLEKVVSKLINESSNASFVNMSEDSVILYDHVEGDFYIADYSVNEESLVFEFSNFEKIELISDEKEFKESVSSYFEEEDMTAKELVERYVDEEGEKFTFLENLISESLTKKDFNFVDYDEIKKAKEGIYLESEDSAIVEAYKKRIYTHPMKSIKYFNWESPVKVSLLENERVKIVRTSFKEKASSLWKSKSFKEDFNSSIKDIVENTEDSFIDFIDLISENKCILSLSEAERNELFGKILISSNLSSSRREIMKGLNLFFESDALKEMSDDFLTEEGEEAEVAPEGEAEVADETPPEADEKELDKILSDLKKIAEKTEEEDTKKALDALIEKFSKQKEEGTNVDTMKEAISLLYMV
jgi:hypothetical protein